VSVGTAAVAAESALADPALFDAVTSARSLCPASPDATV
jgi:hypothetical protein